MQHYKFFCLSHACCNAAGFNSGNQCHFYFLCFIGNSSLDEDDATLLSEGRNLQNELQISSIRLSTSLPYMVMIAVLNWAGVTRTATTN